MKKIIFIMLSIAIVMAGVSCGRQKKSDISITSTVEQMKIAILQADINVENEEFYIGNRRSGKFHRADCYTLPKEKNRVEFSSRSEAIDRGYLPCSNCNP